MDSKNESMSILMMHEAQPAETVYYSPPSSRTANPSQSKNPTPQGPNLPNTPNAINARLCHAAVPTTGSAEELGGPTGDRNKASLTPCCLTYSTTANARPLHVLEKALVRAMRRALSNGRAEYSNPSPARTPPETRMVPCARRAFCGREGTIDVSTFSKSSSWNFGFVATGLMVVGLG
ncbi:hypothetical protein FRB94_014482 [Tulasnella sp. JGI-2019a]|nr:hypothetical protein FRB94_014482 [Tulasnella sp. JGI-2019a]